MSENINTNKLSNNIWITRKCRILASERLANYDLISQILVNYYAIYLVALSVCDLYYKNLDLSLQIVVGSILVSTTSLFISSRNFKERSLILKNCYTKLNSMYRNTIRAESNVSSNLIELENEYDSFINNFENHHHIDYLILKYQYHFDKHNHNLKLLKTEWGELVLRILIYWLVVFTLFLLPLIITFKLYSGI